MKETTNQLLFRRTRRWVHRKIKLKHTIIFDSINPFDLPFLRSCNLQRVTFCSAGETVEDTAHKSKNININCIINQLSYPFVLAVREKHNTRFSPKILFHWKTTLTLSGLEMLWLWESDGVSVSGKQYLTKKSEIIKKKINRNQASTYRSVLGRGVFFRFWNVFNKMSFFCVSFSFNWSKLSVMVSEVSKLV